MKLPLFNTHDTYKRSLLKRCVFIIPAPTNIYEYFLCRVKPRECLHYCFKLFQTSASGFQKKHMHEMDLSTSFTKHPWESYHLLESSQPQPFRPPVLAMTQVNKHIKYITLLINLSYPNNRGV